MKPCRGWVDGGEWGEGGDGGTAADVGEGEPRFWLLGLGSVNGSKQNLPP